MCLGALHLPVLDFRGRLNVEHSVLYVLFKRVWTTDFTIYILWKKFMKEIMKEDVLWMVNMQRIQQTVTNISNLLNLGENPRLP